jgi:hypothetical protein
MMKIKNTKSPMKNDKTAKERLRACLKTTRGAVERVKPYYWKAVPGVSTFFLPKPAKPVRQQVRQRQRPFAENKNARMLFMFLNSSFLILTFH